MMLIGLFVVVALQVACSSELILSVDSTSPQGQKLFNWILVETDRSTALLMR
jgi:hypothetical protein